MPRSHDGAATEPLILVVLLFLHADGRDRFERFESGAASIMSRYGGKIVHRIAFVAPRDPSVPDELHVVAFPDRAAFDRYRSDPDLQALGALRQRAIARSVIWEGCEAMPFATPAA